MDAERYAEAIRVVWDRSDPDRERLQAFQRATRRLSRCLDRAEVAAAVFDIGLELVGADEATISALISPDEVEILYAYGTADDLTAPKSRLRLREWGPAAEAVRTLAPVWLESPAEIRARYPELEAMRARRGHDAWVLVPLVADDSAMGVLGLVYRTPHRFDASERSYIVALADQCAQAMHRAMLFGAEAESRRRAEAAEQSAKRTVERLALSEDLAGALDDARTEAQVARVAFDTFSTVFGAVAGILTRRTVDDELELVHAFGRPEDAPASSRRLHARSPHAEVFRTRRPMWLPGDVDVEPSYPELVKALRLREAAWMAAPLRSEGSISGTLSLTLPAQPSPREGDTEVRKFLLRMVGQCERALSRTRLAEAERVARRAAETAEVEARRLGKLQDEFVAVVAHDLRTPLGAILLTVKTLFTGTNPTESQARKVARVLASVDRINLILRTLRDFTRARLAGGIPLEVGPLDVGGLVRRAVAETEAAHPGRVVHACLEGDLAIVGDGGRLLQVLANLLGNALQHGAVDAPVNVSARGEGAAIVVEVHNEGPPIPPALMPFLFQPFQQGTGLAPGTEQSGSVGLGLFIVHEIVHAHGGAVTVDSGATRGTTFTVVVPRLQVCSGPGKTPAVAPERP